MLTTTDLKAYCLENGKVIIADYPSMTVYYTVKTRKTRQKRSFLNLLASVGVVAIPNVDNKYGFTITGDLIEYSPDDLYTASTIYGDATKLVHDIAWQSAVSDIFIPEDLHGIIEVKAWLIDNFPELATLVQYAGKEKINALTWKGRLK